MSVELTGKVFRMLPPQSGSSARGEWKKQEFVIETDEQYPKKVAVSAWNAKADEVAQLAVGTPVRLEVNIESREYNGKWYTDVRVWSVRVDGGPAIDPEYSGPAYSDMPPQTDIPYATSQPASDIPLPSMGDELPF